MKILTLLFVLAIIGNGCSTEKPEAKAKKLIKEQLFATMHDYKSYEEVKYGKLDSSYSDVADDSLYKEYTKSIKECLEEGKKNNEQAGIYAGLSTYTNKFKFYVDKAKKESATATELLAKIDAMTDAFVPQFSGWQIQHSFRAKSLSGDLGIHHYEYFFDKEMGKIVKQEDVGENAVSKE